MQAQGPRHGGVEFRVDPMRPRKDRRKRQGVPVERRDDGGTHDLHRRKRSDEQDGEREDALSEFDQDSLRIMEFGVGRSGGILQVLTRTARNEVVRAKAAD
jgi:hypothetical protein